MHNVGRRRGKDCRNQKCASSSRTLPRGFQWVRGIRSRQIALAQVIQHDPNDPLFAWTWDIRKNIRKDVLRRSGEGLVERAVIGWVFG